MRRLKESDVEFKLEVMPDDMEVRGNAVVSGDPTFDKNCEDEILARLDSGDVWAWCMVRVTATWKGLEGWDVLGGCSYESEEDFKAGGYYEDMKAQALADLQQHVDGVVAGLKSL